MGIRFVIVRFDQLDIEMYLNHSGINEKANKL